MFFSGLSRLKMIIVKASFTMAFTEIVKVKLALLFLLLLFFLFTIISVQDIAFKAIRLQLSYLLTRPPATRRRR